MPYSKLTPEHTGRSDGKKGYPTSADTLSEFEQIVRELFERHLQQLRGSFSQIEGPLSAEYLILTASLPAAREVCRKLSQRTESKIVDWRLPHSLAVPGAIFMALLAASVMYFTRARNDGGPELAVVFALVMAGICGTAAFLGGLFLHRSKTPVEFWFSVAWILAPFLVSTMVVAAQDQPALSMTMRLSYALLTGVAMLAVTILAHWSHDETRDHSRSLRNLAKLNEQVARIVAQRNSNRDSHVAQALASRDHAQGIVRTYRHQNRLTRPDSANAPPFFDEDPVMKCDETADFRLLTANDFHDVSK